MSDKDGILIKNIFSMLAFAYKSLKYSNNASIKPQSFDFKALEDLFAVILSKGIAQQLKQGLHKEYISHSDNLQTLRGQIDFGSSIKNLFQRKCSLTCEYDDLSENNSFNQILKTTAKRLIRCESIKKENQEKLSHLMAFFSNVDEIDVRNIRWDRLQYQRNNLSYELLMNICRLALDALLPSEIKGKFKMQMFSDENMAHLYERFILEYYKEKYKLSREIKVAAKKIKWATTDEVSDPNLPEMKTDIFLTDNNRKTLIIDAKYYSKTMISNQGGREKYRSNNLYQIFTYVKNYEYSMNSSQDVEGVLLYARTQEKKIPDARLTIAGNQFRIMTLDLNTEFSDITKQLDAIVDEFFS